MPTGTVLKLTEQSRKMLEDCDPSTGDPTLAEAWELLLSVTSMAGSKLMEKQFGGLVPAADEVALYMGHMDRVTRVGRDAPFAVPASAVRPLKAAGRLLDETKDLDELESFLWDLPPYASAMSGYLARTAGRRARPVIDVLDLATRAGGVYRDCLARTIPPA